MRCETGYPLPFSSTIGSVLIGILWLVAVDASAAEPTPQNYREILRGVLQVAEQRQTSVIEGSPGWLFFTPELRAVNSNPFWGENATQTSRSTNPKFADPLGPILDFHTQLKAAGIELWMVPVPAKVSVYPEMCRPVPQGKKTGRIDTSHADFYQLLREKDVPVVDLTDEFVKRKTDAATSLYCQTDSHWSGHGVQVAAKSLAAGVKKAGWYQGLAKRQFRTELHSVEITGDLALLLDDDQPIKEKLTLTRVLDSIGKPCGFIADDAASPVLLLGDSHTLVFHDPTLYAEGCGLADHLAEQLGFPIDVIGVRGSGANAARLNWRRRPDSLTGKKLVIWCFSMREFTENTDGWRQIPIMKR